MVRVLRSSRYDLRLTSIQDTAFLLMSVTMASFFRSSARCRRVAAGCVVGLTCGLTFGLVVMITGCTTSQAADWAQMSPPLAPVPASPGLVHLGARTDAPKVVVPPSDDDPSPRRFPSP